MSSGKVAARSVSKTAQRASGGREPSHCEKLGTYLSCDGAAINLPLVLVRDARVELIVVIVAALEAAVILVTVLIVLVPILTAVAEPLPPDPLTAAHRAVSATSALRVGYVEFPGCNQTVTSTGVQDTPGAVATTQDSASVESE